MSAGRYYAALFLGPTCIRAIRTTRKRFARAWIAQQRKKHARLAAKGIATFRIGRFRRAHWRTVSPWEVLDVEAMMANHRAREVWSQVSAQLMAWHVARDVERRLGSVLP